VAPESEYPSSLIWNKANVDPSRYTQRPSLALDSLGYPHISYYDSNSYNLKYAKWTGTEWNIQTVAAYVDVGVIALHSTGNPRICYCGFQTGLTYAELIDPAVTPPIPEFSSWLILSSVVAATGFIAACKIRLFRKR